MNKKKYQIFISSTYKDLITARNKAMETILGLYQFPIGMEMFSADDSEQWEVIKQTINLSDYYIILIGHRYGSLTQEGISYTEKEYDYAKECKIPILTFIQDRNVPTTTDEREQDPSMSIKLNNFIDKVSATKMCDFWKKPEELPGKIAIALVKAFTANPQIGWTRVKGEKLQAVSSELAETISENRKLREKIEELEKLLVTQKPVLSVSLNSNDPIELTVPTLPSPSKYPQLLRRDHIPAHLTPYITDYDITSYNNSLPSKEEFEEYNKNTRYYHLKKASIDFDISIKNDGKLKAKDIFVTIELPDFVEVQDKFDSYKNVLPKNPIPKSLLEKAKEKYIKDNNIKPKTSFGVTGGLVALGSIIKPYSLEFSSTYDDIIPHLTKSQSINSWSSVKDKTITINVKNLIHTRQKTFDDFVLLPLKAGSGFINISIICEEYDEAENYTFPINVSK
ncbi:DUF4062 domain-containing protein [Desulfovibrio gilichinskyi]|uniref:DUF4062 domain-containing protein n=1 Tax=Desulfovibrio gilichinskyi TaxID=1519643 RepID=A0A1X7E0S2_9BACT|nr:DUF4062 domain-containing protein [Desulfovibrio gilichinskyi]SMF25222.1 protein of unknown function [Desulfovibrio gilichinskyi]